VDTTVAAAGPEPGMPPALPSKEPWLGANLSLCVPGLGQWYAGARASGALEIGAWLVLMIGGAYLALAPGGNGAVGMILLLGLIPLWLFSAWSAHRSCRARAAPGFDELRRSQRDAWKAVFFARFLPGLGQLYDRRFGIGALFLVAAVAMAPIEGPAGSLLYGSLMAAGCVDAWFRSRARRDGSPRALWGIAAVVWVVICGGPLVAAYLESNVVRAFKTASASMAPTLEPGDRVLADLKARGRARLGDIVLLPFPTRPDQLFLKTVFAGPDDLVEFRADGAYRNGQRVLDHPADPAHLVSIGFGREGSPYRVPPGSIFVIGDNYLNSNDSRFFGPIALDAVQGRAYKIYWPPGRARTL
jgi:signal peptidase I